jgi:hypothetical protein
MKSKIEQKKAELAELEALEAREKSTNALQYALSQSLQY